MHIWTLVLDNETEIPAHILDAARDLLSSTEIDRAKRFIRVGDKNRFVLAHTFCRLMLSHFGSQLPQHWQFDKEERGRPLVSEFMNKENIDFNITHTTKGIACALAFDRRVGIDMEYKQRNVNLDMLVEKQFSTLEQSQFISLTEPQRLDLFFKIWTLKESYIKVTGRGLSEPLQGFGFDLEFSQPLLYLESINEKLVSRTCLDKYRFGLADVGENHQLAWSIDCSNNRTKEKKGSDSLNTEPELEPIICHYRLDDLRGLLNADKPL